MAIGQRDSHTGWTTTGHEWNGILELNTPVPKPVWFFLALAAVVSVVYWVLMPAWPLGTTFTRGILGNDQGADVREAIRAADADPRAWRDRVSAMPVEAMAEDPELAGAVRATGAMLFAENCSACHGRDGSGQPGFPNLANDKWQWGGSPEEILETLRVGVNSLHPETRLGVMQAFGEDGILDRDTVLALVTHVRSLSGLEDPGATDPETRETGAAAFAENCATCHGDAGTGLAEFGAPDLTDGTWLYGSDREAIFRTVWHGREGWMPSWDGRLTEADRRILTFHVLDLAGRIPAP